MPLAESLVSGENDLAPVGDGPRPRVLVNVWTSTAAAAVLHAVLLFAGSQAEAAPPEEAHLEAIDQLRRYLAASETRDPPLDAASSESQARALNRLARGANGAGAGGDDVPGDGTQEKASPGKLDAATTGAGSGKSGKGIAALPPFKFRYGKLPAEVIQRIVRQNFGRFRRCIEQSRNGGWHLDTRVTVRFVIDESGAVTSATVTESSMWDGEIRSCLVRAFFGLSFPQPQGGIVVVSYPLSFSPGG